MPREVPPLSSPVALAAERDELDPELLALPNPPHRTRTLAIAALALAATLALAMAFALWRDVAYAFAGEVAATLGDLRAAPPEALASAENHFVRAEGMLGAAGGIRYERPFDGDSFRAMPVAGRAGVWVDLRVPSGQENGRWEPPRSFAGRLVRFDSAGVRHRGVAAAIERATGKPLPSGSWLLLDGDVPADARRSVVIVAVLIAFALWNGTSIARIVRRAR